MILKTYLAVTKPRKQEKGSGIHDCSREKGRIYTSCSGTASVYTWLSGEKGHISFKTRLGKGKRLKNLDPQ
jgi:hypothetical protein